MSTSNTVTCPHCRGAIANDPALAGQVVQCPYCKSQLTMPSLPTVKPVQVAAARAVPPSRPDNGFPSINTRASGPVRTSIAQDSKSNKRADDIVLQGGQGKTLIVARDAIRIVKKGILTGKREKTILIRNITSVEVKKPGGFVGFIQFSIAGGEALNSSFTLTGGAYDAVLDENSVVFNGKKNYEIALKIKAYVESWSDRAVASSPQAASASVADEIKKLKALVDEGLVTPEEFERKKQQLLGLT